MALSPIYLATDGGPTATVRTRSPLSTLRQAGTASLFTLASPRPTKYALWGRCCTVMERVCLFCGQPFVPRRSNQRYCGAQCQRVARLRRYYQRHRDRLLAYMRAYYRRRRAQTKEAPVQGALDGEVRLL